MDSSKEDLAKRRADWLRENPPASATHVCVARPVPTKGSRVPVGAEWGPAVDEIALIDGVWWALARDWEYATVVRFCPFCGVELVGRGANP